MMDKVQLFSLNFNNSQKKSEKKTFIKDYPADEFVRSDKSLSFKGGNFFESFIPVTKNFYRGKQPKDLADFQMLKEMGIKAVIDLIGDGQSAIESIRDQEKKIVEQLGMKYFKIPLLDNKRPSDEHIQKFLKIVEEETNLPVFVHCRGGKDRTGLVTAIYSFGQENGFRSAYTDMLKNGHDFYFNSELDKYLEDYYIKNYCKEEDSSFIRKTAQLLRKSHLKRLGITEEQLNVKYPGYNFS
jgi:protein-tyrosine phosphatase